MKLTKPENESYAGTIVTIKEVHPLEGSDNIVGTNIFGFQAIVGKDTLPGEVGVFFPAETQLSEEFCYENNLHQHGNLNKDEGRKLEGKIPENFLVYGELIGWTPTGTPIQRNYTYNVPRQTCDLYIYRVAFVNAQGKVVDLSWDQVMEFCRDTGLRHVPELWRGPKKDLIIEEYEDKYYLDEGHANAVPLSEGSPCDEGVCVRVDGLAPYILKMKGPLFREHETKMLDAEAEDLESEGSQEQEGVEA